jgi:hypothetical protein
MFLQGGDDVGSMVGYYEFLSIGMTLENYIMVEKTQLVVKVVSY